jgi:hypothetical protein
LESHRRDAKTMIELRQHAFEVVRPLFSGIEHSVALVHSVIEGNSRGRILVDRLESPSSAYLILEGAFHFVAGNPDDQEFKDGLVSFLFDDLLSGTGEPQLILFAFSDAWRQALDGLLNPYGAKRIARQMFSFHPARFEAHVGWRERLPHGVRVERIDQHLVEAHPEYLPLLDEASKRFGVCVTVEGKIASDCSAVAVGGGEAEVDIHTQGESRRQGHAMRAACAFIEECLARDLTPNWSCWPQREASCALALKLGFEAMPDVPAHFWTRDA